MLASRTSNRGCYGSPELLTVKSQTRLRDSKDSTADIGKTLCLAGILEFGPRKQNVVRAVGGAGSADLQPPSAHTHTSFSIPSPSLCSGPPSHVPISCRLNNAALFFLPGWRAALHQHCPPTPALVGGLLSVKEWPVNTRVCKISMGALCPNRPPAHPISPHRSPSCGGRARGLCGCCRVAAQKKKRALKSGRVAANCFNPLLSPLILSPNTTQG